MRIYSSLGPFRSRGHWKGRELFPISPRCHIKQWSTISLCSPLNEPGCPKGLTLLEREGKTYASPDFVWYHPFILWPSPRRPERMNTVAACPCFITLLLWASLTFCPLSIEDKGKFVATHLGIWERCTPSLPSDFLDDTVPCSPDPLQLSARNSPRSKISRTPGLHHDIFSTASLDIPIINLQRQGALDVEKVHQYGVDQ